MLEYVGNKIITVQGLSADNSSSDIISKSSKSGSLSFFFKKLPNKDDTDETVLVTEVTLLVTMDTTGTLISGSKSRLSVSESLQSPITPLGLSTSESLDLWSALKTWDYLMKIIKNVRTIVQQQGMRLVEDHSQSPGEHSQSHFPPPHGWGWTCSQSRTDLPLKNTIMDIFVIYQ